MTLTLSPTLAPSPDSDTRTPTLMQSARVFIRPISKGCAYSYMSKPSPSRPYESSRRRNTHACSLTVRNLLHSPKMATGFHPPRGADPPAISVTLAPTNQPLLRRPYARSEGA